MIWICFEILSSVQDTINKVDTGNGFLAVTSLSIQPSYRTQNCSLPIPHHQNAFTTTNNRETTIWMEYNTSHGMKQQFPRETHNKPENTNATKNPPKTG